MACYDCKIIRPYMTEIFIIGSREFESRKRFILRKNVVYICDKCDEFYIKDSSRLNGFSEYNPYFGSDDRISTLEYDRIIKEDQNSFTPTYEQIAMTNELKSNRKPAIIPDSEFHNYFCDTMKKVTDKNYCYEK